MANSDSAVLAIASAGPVERSADVPKRLAAIEAELDDDDGLIWFNRLYQRCADLQLEGARKQRLSDPLFAERLDCQCADLYLQALAAHLSDPGSGPAAWKPLFETRTRSGILPVQYALAGLNAHFNRDLSLALAATFVELDRQPLREEAIHADYQRIGATLEASLSETKTWLLGLDAAGGQTLPEQSHTVLEQGQAVLELWSSKRACEAAWVASEVRWALRASPSLARHHLDALDRLVGLAGRGLLRPPEP